MGQLMSEKALALGGILSVLALCEDDVMSVGEGLRLHGSRQLVSHRVCVYPDIGEVVSHSMLEKRPRGFRQGPSATI